MEAAREPSADEAPRAAATASAVARVQPAVLQLQRTIGNRATRRVLARSLDDDYQAALGAGDWPRAAELLNGFNIPDILRRLAVRSPDEVDKLHRGAIANQRVGPDSNVARLTPPLLTAFSRDYRASAEIIRGSTEAMKLIAEAEAAHVSYGGYAEDGPAHDAWPYTVGSSVYVPRAHTHRVEALSDFLFELNNAIRQPAISALQQQAAAGTIDARGYARGIVGQEVQGMLRLAKVWLDVKATMGGGHELDRWDSPNYVTQYRDVQAGRRTEAQVVTDVLGTRYTQGTNRGKTIEQNYVDQATQLRAAATAGH
jgi:hypothetical protein